MRKKNPTANKRAFSLKGEAQKKKNDLEKELRGKKKEERSRCDRVVSSERGITTVETLGKSGKKKNRFKYAVRGNQTEATKRRGKIPKSKGRKLPK